MRFYCCRTLSLLQSLVLSTATEARRTAAKGAPAEDRHAATESGRGKGLADADGGMHSHGALPGLVVARAWELHAVTVAVDGGGHGHVIPGRGTGAVSVVAARRVGRDGESGAESEDQEEFLKEGGAQR